MRAGSRCTVAPGEKALYQVSESLTPAAGSRIGIYLIYLGKQLSRGLPCLLRFRFALTLTRLEIQVAEVHDGGSRINAAQRNHTFQQALNAVNPSSEPSAPFCPAGLPVVPAYYVTFQDRGTGSTRCGQAELLR